MFQNLEIALLLEGLSDKAKRFHDLIQRIVSAKPARLLQVVVAQTEGVFELIATISEGSEAPKGELKELARGKTHRVVAIRFPTVDGEDIVVYIVVPLADMSGEEVKDKQILSAISTRLKAIHKDLQHGVPENQLELDTIFKVRSAAIQKLHAIDRDIVAAGESPAKIVMKDPVRGIVSKLIVSFYPDAAKKYVAALAALDRGTIEQQISGFSWNSSNIPPFTRMAAGAVADRDLGDPATIKFIAGLAVAYMATQILESEAAA